MSDIVEEAAGAMRRMPPAERDSVARAVLSLGDGGADLAIEREHMAAVLEGLAQIERGDVIEGDPENLVAAAFRRQP